MKIKILAILGLIILLNTCKKEQSTELKQEIHKTIPTVEPPKNIIVEHNLNYKTQNVVKNWEEYHQIQNIVNNSIKSNLSYFKTTTQNTETFFSNLSLNTPMAVNTFATQARITALKTKFLKLKSLSNLGTTTSSELKIAIFEFAESFSNLNFQMNKKLEKDGNFIQKPQ